MNKKIVKKILELKATNPGLKVLVGDGINYFYKEISLNDAKKKLIDLDFVSKCKCSLCGSKATDYYFQKIRAKVKTGKRSQYTHF